MLTPREYEVLALMAHGVRRDVMCERMGVSRVTMYQHVKNAYRKLDVSCTADAFVAMGWMIRPPLTKA